MFLSVYANSSVSSVPSNVLRQRVMLDRKASTEKCCYGCVRIRQHLWGSHRTMTTQRCSVWLLMCVLKDGELLHSAIINQTPGSDSIGLIMMVCASMCLMHWCRLYFGDVCFMLLLLFICWASSWIGTYCETTVYTCVNTCFFVTIVA